MLLALASGVLGTGCMRRADIWVVPGPTASTLAFGVAQKRAGNEPVESLDLVMVQTCYERDRARDVLWKASGPALEGGTAPTHIRYGVPPAGFNVLTGPRTLTPGCYEVSISGTGVSASERFVLDSAGTLQAE